MVQVYLTRVSANNASSNWAQENKGNNHQENEMPWFLDKISQLVA